MADCCSSKTCGEEKTAKRYLTFRRQDGAPWTPMYVRSVDPAKCIGCGLCVKVCAGECYEMREVEGSQKAVIVNPGTCLGDCHCHKICPVEGGAMACHAVEIV
ncbi:MAG: 4Fe-4S binding protein [Desulfuromonadales bacterium]|nr:4Fe-4S binding protein [Desulfuromonadales bacterium]